MGHILLHNIIDTPSHTPTHTRLLEHRPPYNRLLALVLKWEPTINTSIFICWVEVNIITEKHLHKLSNYPAPHRISDGGCWTSPLHKVWATTITDGCDTRWVQLRSPSPCSMAQTMYNGLPRWPYFSNSSKCMVSSKDTTTRRSSQQQTRPLQRRPLSQTGWIAMVLPDRLSCSAWNRGYKQNTRSSTMRRRFGRG